jgi:hypothetical protein
MIFFQTQVSDILGVEPVGFGESSYRLRELANPYGIANTDRHPGFMGRTEEGHFETAGGFN